MNLVSAKAIVRTALEKQWKDVEDKCENAFHWGRAGRDVGIAASTAEMWIRSITPRGDDGHAYLVDVLVALSTASRNTREGDGDEEGFQIATLGELIRDIWAALEKSGGKAPFDLYDALRGRATR